MSSTLISHETLSVNGGHPDELRRPIINELYRAFALLGAESDLLGTLGSWGDSLPDEDVLLNLQAWNAAQFREIKARIEHYEMSCPHQDDTRAAQLKTVAQASGNY